MPRHRHAFGQRHRGQGHPADHVADGADRWLAGAVGVVDLDEALVVQFHRDVFQPQVVQHRPAAGGIEHTIGLEHPAILERRHQAAVRLALDAGDVAVELQVHALPAQFVAQVLAHAAVEAAQEQVAAIQQGGLRTKAMEDRGEFHGDVAAADHQHAAWQLFEEERLVGADRVFLAGDVRNLRPAAGGDEDVGGAEALAIDLHRVRVANARVAFQQGHPAVHQQIAVDAVEALDFAVLVGDQLAPVELGIFQRPAKACGLLEVVGEMRAVDQQFFWHTADVDTGTTQVTACGNRHFCTKACGETRRTHTAGTGTNHEQIKIVGHFSLLARPSAYPD
ncbi:hypothetical protein D9M73_143100 [compost metagenome]